MERKVFILSFIISLSWFNVYSQDPNFLWAKQIGGASDDRGQSIAVDANGNVYTTGTFVATVDFDPGPLTHNMTSAGIQDIFISKFDAEGNFLWAKQFGSTSYNFGYSITVDVIGNVYTTGQFVGVVDFDPGPGVTNLDGGGGSSAYVSKLDASGNFLWAKHISGNFSSGQSIAVGANGNVYTTGWFALTADFDPGGGTFNMTSFGAADIFVNKLDASGNFLWAKQMGGTSDQETGYSITVDANQNVYTTGNFSGTADFDPGPATFNLTTPFGLFDIFVSKLDASGNFIWAKQMGDIGASNDIGRAITVDASGNVYTTGSFLSTADFDPGPGIFNLSSEGLSDIFISKLDASGNFLWAKRIGDGNNDEGKSIVVDNSGNVYTTGFFYGTVDFDPGPGTSNLSSAGEYDIFVSKLDASGNFLWSKRMGGPSYEEGSSIAVNANNNVYITGLFISTVDFDPGTGTYNLTSAGNNDAFIVKLGEEPPPVVSPANFNWAKRMGGANQDQGNSITVDANGNVYTTGSFIGTVDFDPGTGIHNLSTLGGSDVFISKLDASGNFIWAKELSGLGGGATSEARSIAVDANGNVYTTGNFFASFDFDPGAGTYNLDYANGNIFISKLDASGNFIWAKQFGNPISHVSSMTLDPNGNIHTTGYFSVTADFDPGTGTYNLTTGNWSDIFISKLDGSGNLIWAKQIGAFSADADGGNSIAVDASGNVYTTGSFRYADFDPGPGTYILGSSGSFDKAFVSKLDASGNFVWAKGWGEIDVFGFSIAIDANRNVYTTGRFNGTVDFDPDVGTHNLNSNGNASDVFVSKLDASGNFLWAKGWGGAINDFGNSIAVDANGNVFTTGFFDGTADFDPGTGTYNLVSAGSRDIFVSRLSASGNFIWAKQMGGPDQDEGSSIAVDANENVYTTGFFMDNADFDPGTGIYNLTSAGSFDIFIVKLSRFPVPYRLTYITAQNAIKPNGNQLTIIDPIQLGTGTYSYKYTDIKIPSLNGQLNFTRFYNSLNGDTPGPLGYGWSHTYNYFIENKQDTAWDIHYPDGHVSTFIPMNNSGQSFPVFSGTFDSLQKNINTSYSLFTKEKLQYHFDPTGKLDSIIDLNNNITRLYYTGNALDSVVAPGGRSLVITYLNNKIASVKDPLNRICNYGYDADNNLITIQDANSGTASFTYDNAHRMLTVVNPVGNTIVTNTYDISGKVVQQKDAYNQVTSIVYNSPNPGDATVTNPDNSRIIAHHDNYIRKTHETDELGFTKAFGYDANSNENKFTNENNQSETRLFDNYGNLLSDTLPGGKITQISYNNFNSPVQLTDAKGYQKNFYYNSSNNNLDSIRYPDNALQVFHYNSKGQVTQSVDGNGHSTAYSYSPAGDLLSVQTFAGIKQFTYDAAGRKISSTDENGHTTTYAYDNNDNILLITDPLGRTIENTYDANKQLLSVKDKKGFVTTYAYDNKGRKISTTNPKGGVTAYAYDTRDNLISVTDANNNVVSYTYDAKGRKTSAINALGTAQYQYDAVGNLTKIIDPTNKTTDYTYTATNKKQSQTDGLSNTFNYGYDLNDNLTSVTDPLNRVTSYGYDVMNRLASVADAANKTTAVTYDKNGNKKTVVDPNGHTQTYNYDDVNRLINYLDASGNSYTYSYDNAGNNTILTKPTGTIGKVFDAANRVITVNNSTGDNYQFTYDNNDNVITMSNGAGTTAMVYDSLNQLTQYRDPYNKTVSFTYDAAGNKTSVIYPGGNTVSYAYDNANNLLSVADWLGHTFTYTYDAAGRTTQLLYPNGAHCNYEFDNAGRLISKINSFSNNAIISGSTFTLDAIGNRITEQRLGQVPSALLPLSRAYSYANDDRMLSDSIWNFTNDNSGNRTAESNGTKTASYIFSVDNLLNSWVDTAGINSIYSYNPFGNRIAKVVGANSNRYVLDISSGLSVISQITDASGAVKSNYVYGLGLLESVDASNNALYYHFDAMHNTTVLTDQNAVIKDTYTYDPFGTLLSHTGTTTQPFTFLGEYGVEQESSVLYYARARYYDAANGRFLSKDVYPIDLNNPQTLNRYVYATNNPVSIFDYTGLFANFDNTDSKSNVSEIQNLLGFHKTGGNFNEIIQKIGGSTAFSFLETGLEIISNENKSFNYLYGSFNSSLRQTRNLLNRHGLFNKLRKNPYMSAIGDFVSAYGIAKTYVDRIKGKISNFEFGSELFVKGYPLFAEVIGGPLVGLAAHLSIAAGTELWKIIEKTDFGGRLTDIEADIFFR